MSDFRVFETDEFLKRLKKLESRNVEFLQRKLEKFVYPQIEKEPFWGNNIKKLRGYSPDTWRYRIGKLRLFYTVDQKDHIIFILTIDDRKDAYK